MAPPTQQFLGLRGTVQSENAFTCRGIFSANYLLRHFAEQAGYPALGEIQELHREVETLWRENVSGLRSPKNNEAYTRTHFLDPVLKMLGWDFIPEAKMPKPPKGTRKKFPDYCLFCEVHARQNAAQQADAAGLYAFSDSVLEAKRWEHSLDKASEKETPGQFPSEQVEGYLRDAKDASGTRYFSWGRFEQRKRLATILRTCRHRTAFRIYTR